MRKQVLIGSVTLFACLGALISCGNDEPGGENGQDNKPFPKNENIFTNPVIRGGAPDPSIIRAKDGKFYLYTGENAYSSDDMINWEHHGSVFSEKTHPTWNPRGGVWASDINYFDGRYVLYYAKSEWGGEWDCGIGVATCDNPLGPFVDHGPLFISRDIQVQNSIDQYYIEDHGKKYLVWGSFHGIYVIELSDDGLSVKPGAEKVQIAGGFMEGSYVHVRDGKYYLFGSAGTCCEGSNSTYSVTVGRADNLFGPYYDKNGGKLLDNHYETILTGDSRIAGPGHNSEIITDDEGTDWIMYHGWVRGQDDMGRQGFLDRVDWVDGWPKINNGHPSTSCDKPVFK